MMLSATLETEDRLKKVNAIRECEPPSASFVENSLTVRGGPLDSTLLA